MQDLKVTFLQYDLHWEDKVKNLKKIEELLNNCKETNLIILPEMFATGFSMNASSLSEDFNGETVQWMKKTALKKNTVLCGSIIFREKNSYFNRLLVIFPEGAVEFYDKRHLFRMGEENKIYSSGRKKLFFMIKGWKISPFICYDLRFPVWTRNFRKEFDLGIYIANWPAKRVHHWNTLLKARAIENQAYIIGVNRIGTDGNNLYYSGDSKILDPSGVIISDAADYEIAESHLLSYSALSAYREQFPVWKDCDGFKLVR